MQTVLVWIEYLIMVLRMSFRKITDFLRYFQSDLCCGEKPEI